jgi:sulfur carrier protein ThiS
MPKVNPPNSGNWITVDSTTVAAILKELELDDVGSGSKWGMKVNGEIKTGSVKEEDVLEVVEVNPTDNPTEVLSTHADTPSEPTAA